MPSTITEGNTLARYLSFLECRAIQRLRSPRHAAWRRMVYIHFQEYLSCWRGNIARQWMEWNPAS
jgi:hypothetical protein